jgi:hypothetical protein
MRRRWRISQNRSPSRRNDDFLHACARRCHQHIKSSFGIDTEAGTWIHNALLDACLSCKMNNGIATLNSREDGPPVENITLVKLDVQAPIQLSATANQTIEDSHFPTTGQARPCQVRADETRSARYENPHGRTCLPSAHNSPRRAQAVARTPEIDSRVDDVWLNTIQVTNRDIEQRVEQRFRK